RAAKSVDPSRAKPTTVGRTAARSLHTNSPRSSTPLPACRRPVRSDPSHTPPEYSRSGGGSRSGSSSSGGSSQPEKSTSSSISEILLEQMFEHKHFAQISY